MSHTTAWIHYTILLSNKLPNALKTVRNMHGLKVRAGGCLMPIHELKSWDTISDGTSTTGGRGRILMQLRSEDRILNTQRVNVKEEKDRPKAHTHGHTAHTRIYIYIYIHTESGKRTAGESKVLATRMQKVHKFRILDSCHENVMNDSAHKVCL